MKWGESHAGERSSSKQSVSAIKDVYNRCGFWTRENEMEDDFNDAGFSISFMSDEKVVLQDDRSESDAEYEVPLVRGGSSFTIDTGDIRVIGGDDDDEDDDEDDDWDDEETYR